jgi:poly-gamma-glutamate synthesis protein (capsule biosynthesis protein)
MHPGNVELLKVAGINCCVLSNNHVIDLGFRGLLETLEILRRAGIKIAGAGETASEAASPAILEIIPDIRVAVFGYGVESAGYSGPGRPREVSGVNFIPSLSAQVAAEVIESAAVQSRPEDLVFSVHWGQLIQSPRGTDSLRSRIDSGAVDAIHGHSSHNVRPLNLLRQTHLMGGRLPQRLRGHCGKRGLP